MVNIENLVNDIWEGCTYTTNADAAHTDDNPEVCEEIVSSVADNGVSAIEPGTEDFLVAAAQLDFVDIEADMNAESGYVVTKGVLPEAIFKSGLYTFVPDSMNINFK